MHKFVIIVVSYLAFAPSAWAEPHREWVRGDIQSINGNLVRIDSTDVKLASQMIVEIDTGERASPVLQVGQNVTAVIEDGLVKRVEIHTRKQVHGNGPANQQK